LYNVITYKVERAIEDPDYWDAWTSAKNN